MRNVDAKLDFSFFTKFFSSLLLIGMTFWEGDGYGFGAVKSGDDLPI